MQTQELHRVSSRLSEFVESFAPQLGRSERRHWCKIYLSGLLLDGERKSIQPIAERVAGGDEQALQQFVNQSPWSFEDLLKALRDFLFSHFRIHHPLFILDDTALPKKGRHSVGVAHQYCGALGKLSNCQSLVTWQVAATDVHLPLSARLYLPEEWTEDPGRMDKAGVPKDSRVFKEKWKIALELLDELLLEKRPEAILMDAGYGANREFLRELEKRHLYFVAQIRETDTFWDGSAEVVKPHPSGEKGRPWQHLRMRDARRRPLPAWEWGRRLFSDPRNLKVAKLPLHQEQAHHFATMPAYEAIARPFHRVGARRRLLVEQLDNGDFKYYVSNLPASVSSTDILCKAHSRWKVEQGYQQLKEELGLDHFEGRSWAGLHHHIALCFMAFSFLQFLRLESKKKP